MSDLENRTRYEPAEAEPRVFERWESSGRFHPEPTGSPEENFSSASLRVFMPMLQRRRREATG